MKETTNYNLKKIELTDSPPDITVLNNNWDTIDEELKSQADALATKETPQGAQEKANAALNSAKQYTDQKVGEVAQELAAHLAEIIQINPRDFGVVGDGITDDTVALNNLCNYLGENGGKVTLNKTYLISAPITVNFTNDVVVEIEGTIDSKIICKNMGELNFYNVIVAKNDGSESIGTFYCNGLNIDASACGTGYGQQERMQGITANGVKNVFIERNNINNLYGTGIFILNAKGSVYIAKNNLNNVWGYNPSVDSYGDGIYLAHNIKGAIVELNNIKHDVSNFEEVGRCGIALEYDVKNCLVRSNKIEGYNRAIHVEKSFGGHKIQGNEISACPVSLVWAGEKGNNETIFEENICSTADFVHKGKTLTFYDAIISIFPPNADSPKLCIRNNKVTQVKTNAEVPKPLSINTENVIVENNNEFIADISSSQSNRRIFASSLNNVQIKNNIFKNISTFDISYTKNGMVEDNQIQCEKIASEYSNVQINRNVITPTGTTVGEVLGWRADGTFNDNVVYNYSNNTIDNTRLWNNLVSCEVSGNTFVRNDSNSPESPCKASPENRTDTLFTLRKNIIDDKVNNTKRDLIFVGGWREFEGIKIIYNNTTPDYGTWNIGDKIINTNPSPGSYMGWIRVQSGETAVWKGYGLIQS